jgi:hypothetical protein
MKGIGYLISTASVVLLAMVAWQSTLQNPDLKPLLIGGVLTSILGMFLRYRAHERDRKERLELLERIGLGSDRSGAGATAAARSPLIRPAGLPS